MRCPPVSFVILVIFTSLFSFLHETAANVDVVPSSTRTSTSSLKEDTATETEKKSSAPKSTNSNQALDVEEEKLNEK